jgi:glycosyltransferase involved in cell wall biosynthesis
LAKELNVNNVKFYDPIKKVNIPHLLSSIDVNIFNLMKVEVFKYGISSNKLFDYLCSAKPIVFACQALNSIVKEANAGITVLPENHEQLAQAVIKLYNMGADKRAQMGLNGRKYVEREHDISVLVNKLERLII